MHHSPEIASQARQICTNLLEIYPGRTFFLTVLDTLTCLSEKSLLDIPDQVQFDVLSPK
jgi:integrator complex subunit 7